MPVVSEVDLLVERCLRGEASAWDEFVRRYSRLVHSIPRRYGLSHVDAEDVVQSVMVAAVRHLGSLRDSARLSSWLITTAHRESWRIGRQRGKGVEFQDVVGDLDAPPQEKGELWELQDRVHHALVTLGGRCEELLRALYFRRSEPSYEAIASSLDMPIGSIGPTRARCLKKLEALLAAEGVEP